MGQRKVLAYSLRLLVLGQASPGGDELRAWVRSGAQSSRDRGEAVFKDGCTHVFKGACAIVSADLRLLPAGGRGDSDLITASARPLEIPAPPHLAALK